MSPHTALLVVAGTIGSLVVGLVGLIIGVGPDPKPAFGPDVTLISTSLSENQSTADDRAEPPIIELRNPPADTTIGIRPNNR